MKQWVVCGQLARAGAAPVEEPSIFKPQFGKEMPIYLYMSWVRSREYNFNITMLYRHRVGNTAFLLKVLKRMRVLFRKPYLSLRSYHSLSQYSTIYLSLKSYQATWQCLHLNLKRSRNKHIGWKCMKGFHGTSAKAKICPVAIGIIGHECLFANQYTDYDRCANDVFWLYNPIICFQIITMCVHRTQSRIK